MPISNLQDLENLTDAEWNLLLEDNGLDPTASGVNGFYIESGAGIGPFGLEGVTFYGRTPGGNTVTASYVGVTIGPSADLIGFAVGAGAFFFSGNPKDLKGPSLGIQLFSGISIGGSVDFGLNNTMIFYGGALSVGANISIGSTTRVEVDGVPIYGPLGPEIVSGLNSGATQDEFAAALLASEGVNFNTVYIYSDPFEDGTTMVTVYLTERDRDGEYFVIAYTRFIPPGGDADDAVSNVIVNGVARNVPPKYLTISEEGELLATEEGCFSAGTKISMWNGGEKNIEEIVVGDMVSAFDPDTGELQPRRVKGTSKRMASTLLDYFGTSVTPGHVFFYKDDSGAFGFAPLIDILKQDLAIQNEAGDWLRATTGVAVGDANDAMLQIVCGSSMADGSVKAEKFGSVRLGARVLLDDGREFSLAEIIRVTGGQINDQGMVVNAQHPDGAPFHWLFSDELPSPEDYILKKSAVSKEELVLKDELVGGEVTVELLMNAGIDRVRH